jgi:ribonuclease D
VVVVVDTVEQCRKVVDEVLTHDHPLALDCEGVNLGDKGGSLCLVQIATKSGRCFLFDVEQAGSRLFSEGGLQRVLEDVHVLKVGHDLRADAAALFAQHGVFLNYIFDTQGTYHNLHFKFRNSAC